MILIDHVHMVSDESLDELHAFAERLGLRRRWYQRGHYDVLGWRHARAIHWGATMVSSRELLQRMVGR